VENESTQNGIRCARGRTADFAMSDKSGLRTTSRVKRGALQNILHSLSLLNIHYSPPKENNGHKEDLASKEYSTMDQEHEANVNLARCNFVKNGHALEKL